MTSRVAALACCLLLTACGSARTTSAAPSASPSATEVTSTASGSPAATPTPRPERALRGALAELRSVGRGTYFVTVKDAGAAAFMAEGAFDLRTASDEARVRLMDVTRPGRMLGVTLVKVGRQEYARSMGAQPTPQLRGCFLLQYDEETARNPVDLAGLHLDPYAVLRHAHVTGTSVGSAEVLEATLPLRELAGFVGQSAGPEARDALRASDAEVPIEISLDQGSLDHWDYTGADVAAVVPGTLSDEASSRLLIGEEFSYSLHLDPSVRLTAPPSARVTRDPNRPCGAGTSNV
ncbi:MAG: hypothetical protein U0R80_09390 [Nocardioidaceae bacterium]